MTDTIRLGIAGGSQGRRHVMAFNKIEGVELSAFADPSEQSRERMSGAFGFEKTFQSCTEMVESGSIDAVVIATPTAMRAKHVGEALNAELHTLSEMPPATTASEMSQFATTAGLVGKTYMYANLNRFTPQVQEARNLVESGKLGDIFNAEGRWQLGWWPYENENWRGQSDHGGGVLLDMAAQVIDTLWYVMGCPDPAEAMASQYNFFMKGETGEDEAVAEDSITGMLRFRNGASLNVASSFFAHIDGDRTAWNAPEIREMKINGTQSALDIERGIRTSIDREKQLVSTSYAQAGAPSDTISSQALDFISSIREGRDPRNPAKQAVTLMKILDGLKTSATEKKSVSIKTERSLDDLFNSM